MCNTLVSGKYDFKGDKDTEGRNDKMPYLLFNKISGFHDKKVEPVSIKWWYQESRNKYLYQEHMHLEFSYYYRLVMK